MSESYRPADIVGCGDNSCIFGPPRGIATNGGCRCLDGLPTAKRLPLSRDIQILRRDQMSARAELAALHKRFEEAPEAWIWTDRVCYSREDMHRLIGGRWGTEDVEHVRLLAVEEKP